MKYTILFIVLGAAAYWYFFMRTPADTSTAAKPPCGCGCGGKAPCAGGDITTPTSTTLTKDEILGNLPPILQTQPSNAVRYTSATTASNLPDPMYADLM